MKPYRIPILALVAFIGFIYLLIHLGMAGGMPLVFPSGAIALSERTLMLHAMLLMLIVVVPVYILIVFVAINYRAKNTRATYTPHWEHSFMEEFIWWIIPFEIVLVLAALTWSGTHALNPDRPIESDMKPLTVQVVALPWKWLFIYPEEGVASVNELEIPVGRPVVFQITADAPMNSFWIPDLGGQEYAMSGMVTSLNLIADKPGEFIGKSANYSGEGFADMTFAVHAVDDAEFARWVEEAKTTAQPLDENAYTSLAAPSSATPVRYYGSIPFPFMTIVHASMDTKDEAPSMEHDMNSMQMMHH